MKWIGGNDYTSIPAWFRLKREGDTVTAYESSDGVKWFLVGKNTVPMPKSYLVGLAVSTGTDKVNTTQFDHVSVTSGGSGEKPAGVTEKLTQLHALKLQDTMNPSDIAGFAAHSANPILPGYYADPSILAGRMQYLYLRHARPVGW